MNMKGHSRLFGGRGILLDRRWFHISGLGKPGRNSEVLRQCVLSLDPWAAQGFLPLPHAASRSRVCVLGPAVFSEEVGTGFINKYLWQVCHHETKALPLFMVCY